MLDRLNSGCEPIQTAVLIILPHAEVSSALGVRYVAQSATQAEKGILYQRVQQRSAAPLGSATLLSPLLRLKLRYIVQGTSEVSSALRVRYVAQSACQAENDMLGTAEVRCA